MTIQIGSIVWLKSGSPTMTVVEVFSTQNNLWKCAWFNRDLESKTQNFPADSLTDKKPDNIPVTWM